MVDKFLGNTGQSDQLGVRNGFRELIELYIKQLVSEGKWFSVCHKINDNQVDIMKIKNDNGESLGSIVSGFFPENIYRTAIYRYMLMNFLCYIEVPSVSYRSDTGGRNQTFDKILATANIDVISDWLGKPINDLPDKYKSRVYGISYDDGEDELPYLKLTESKEGVKKVSCPRKNIDVLARGTRVVPLFMLKAGVDALYDKFSKDIVKVDFMKDNGQIRSMFTTTNFKEIREIYGAGAFYDDSVMMSYNGDFLDNKNMTRGYIRVPEIGGSKYDTPTRSINYARIVDLSFNEQPDLSFINIDLSTVVQGFIEGVSDNVDDAEEIISMLEAFGLDGGCWSGESKKFPTRNLQSLIEWVDIQNMLLSTVFQRNLCLFMLSNPQWFSTFTGEPKYNSVGVSTNVGII